MTATHNRRELYVGWPTVKAIVVNKIAPGLLDHYLARQACESQQTEEPADPNRPDNLMKPVPGDHGAHGAFGHRARWSSSQLWLTKNRNWLLALGTLALVASWLDGKEKRSG
ncbi:MAG: hypothetical protein AB9869_08715 [Verrucomicrobiia bacterium]